MRQHGCRRRNAVEPTHPVRPTVDHDAHRIVLNKQRTVSSVAAGTDLDLAARAEKRQLGCPCVRFHLDP